MTMDALRLERLGVTIIAAITIVTGAAQLVAPSSLLPLLNVEPRADAAQLFATIGMFMVLFGAAVLHAQARRAALPVVLLWAGLQKIGASLLVALGVQRGVFAELALAVAAFDFLSGLLYFDLLRRESR
ncbi:MAG TPA: patatin [Casimicrobiaceae bacterium]